MPLVDMGDMLRHAYTHRYAVGAFDLVSLDFLQGIIEGAEACDAPVILSLAESHFAYFDLELLMPAVEAAARRSRVPVAIHLDHGASMESARRAIALGCNGVMVDTSSQPFAMNVARSAEIVRMAHDCGVTVEGELGYVPGVEGEDAERHPGMLVYTTVAEARDYVAQTGIDCLAVSIGTVHGHMRGTPELDFERLAAINEALRLPLVIHGGTGLSDAQFRRLIEHGVAKINYYTALSEAAAAVIRANLTQGGRGYSGLVSGVQAAIRAEVERCIHLWGSAGRAPEVLAQCRRWHNVEHVVLYNAAGLDDAAVRDMMATGQRSLATIPGVREVGVGKAVDGQARYRHCWLIRFAAPAVIASYKHHPVHVDFADRLFRPVAGDRITVDFELTATSPVRCRDVAMEEDRS